MHAVGRSAQALRPPQVGQNARQRRAVAARASSAVPVQGQRRWAAGSPLLRPGFAAARPAKHLGRVVTSAAATFDERTPGEKADLRDALITLVSTATLAVGAAYFAVGLFTEGPVHGLMSRPFSFPATFFMVLAKFVTNAALVLLDHVCTLLYSIPAYAALPLALGLLVFSFRRNALDRRGTAQAYLLDPRVAVKPVIEFYGKFRPKPPAPPKAAAAAAAPAPAVAEPPPKPKVDRSAIRAAEREKRMAESRARREAAIAAEKERIANAARVEAERKAAEARTKAEREAAEAKAKREREEAARLAEKQRVEAAALAQKQREEAAARAAQRKQEEAERAARAAAAAAAAEAAAAAAAAKLQEVAAAAAAKLEEVRAAQMAKAEEEKFAAEWAQAQELARLAAIRAEAAEKAAREAEEEAKRRSSLWDKSLLELSVLAGQCITRDALGSLGATSSAPAAAAPAAPALAPAATGKPKTVVVAATQAKKQAPQPAAAKKEEKKSEGGEPIVIPIGAGSVAKGITLPPLPPLPWAKKNNKE